MSDARKYTNKLLEMVDDGLVDKDKLIVALVSWTSEADVKEFMEAEEYIDEDGNSHFDFY